MGLSYLPSQGQYALTPILPTPTPPDPPVILRLQGGANSPSSDVVSTVTNPVNISPRMADRLSSFPEEVYSLLPTDHLVKLLKVLLGDAGAGQLNKLTTMARLGTVIQGANFYDLDNFYGALFGVPRNPDELYDINPYTDSAEADVWSNIRALDNSYRSRIDQLGRAISFGASAIGMQLIAEAVLQCPCAIFESWKLADEGVVTWSDLESYTWGELEDYTWGEIESLSVPSSSVDRKTFTIVPTRALSNSEAFGLRQIINTIKPADTVVFIDKTGSNSQTEVTISGVAADSSYWGLIESIIPQEQFASFYDLSTTVQPGGWREVLRAALTEYQGEQISYGGDIVGVSAYDTDSQGNIIDTNVIDSYTFQDGTTVYYPPSQAIGSRFFSLAGRYVSDGILQGAPYSNDTQNVPSTTNRAPMSIYVDGMEINNLVAALEDPSIINTLGVNAPDERYWSTPPRLSSDNRTETLDVTLVASRLVNNLTFSIAHFPQIVQVQTFNTESASWETVYSRTIYDSIPAYISSIPPIAHSHPQHSVAGAWDTINVSIPPTEVSQVRLVLQRIPNGTPPVGPVSVLDPNAGSNSNTAPVPYSLGVKDFALGYQVAQESDLPTQPIVTQDALGSQAQFSVRLELPQNAVDGSSVPWRSAPQPTSNSVVNFYLDTRDGSGNPQLVDALFIDPLYIGPHCTVYYSNSGTHNLGFPSDATNLVSPVLTTAGTVTPYGGGLVFDSARPSYVDIENTAIQFDPSQPWWIGAVLAPNFKSYEGDGQTLWDLGNGLNLSFGNNSITLNGGSGTLTLEDISFSSGSTIGITVAYFPIATPSFNAGLYLFFDNNNPLDIERANLSSGRIVQPDPHPIFSSRYITGGYSATFVPESMGVPQPTLRFGGTLSDPGVANFKLVGLALKQIPLTESDLDNFTSTYSTYTEVTGDNTNNALIRYNNSNVSPTNALGWIGGPGDFWNLLSWTPIMRDFSLQKGFMHLPPTSAKYFKLEFTNLIAQPITSLVPITKTFQTHQGTSGYRVQNINTPIANNEGVSPPGTHVAIALANSVAFGDAPILQTLPTAPSSPAVNQPTSVQVAPDYAAQAQLASNAWYWQYQQWAAGPTGPRFVNNGTHNYVTSTISQSNQTSFFVGLSSIAAYRLNFGGTDDTQMYEEVFIDDTFIQTTGIPQNPGDVNTDGLTEFPVIDVSSTYNSTSPVIGVQFATIQSDAVQIAYDDDFGDSATETPYNWNDTSLPTRVGNATLNYITPANTVLVSRDTISHPPPARLSEGLVEDIPFPIFEGVIPSGPEEIGLTSDIGTYGSQPGSEAAGWLGGLGEGPNVGGLANAYSVPTASGMVYGAVRLTTNDTLASPLSLEIVDADSDIVLTSKVVNCSPGQIVEAYVSYELGSVVSSGGPIYTRIVQYGNAQNSWTVDRLSTFNDSWIWEFTNDGTNWINASNIRDNAFGLVTFPYPGTTLKWRLTGVRPNAHVNYLRVRPVYDNVKSDAPLGIVRGPNYSMYDHIPPIDQDPFFDGWHSPIPYWWYAASNEYPILNIPGIPNQNEYSRFYERVADDSASVSDSVTRSVYDFRYPSDSAPSVESLTRELSSSRSTSDSTSESDSAVAVIVHLPDTPDIVAPDVHDLPNPG